MSDQSSQHDAGSAQLNGPATGLIGHPGQPMMSASPQGGQMAMGQPMMMGQQGGQMMMVQPMMMGQQGGQMAMGKPMFMVQPMGQQGGQMAMGQPMMMGQQGGQMAMGQPMMMGQQGGQMAMGQPMMMGQQGGQMAMGQPMMVMGGQQAPWQMQPPQMQTAVPQTSQMYPPPGAVMYNNGQGGMVIMGSPFFNQPNLHYTPTSYMWLSYVTMVLFGLVCPLSLVFSVPAVVMSRKSENATKSGNIPKGRNHGASAVYLNFAAVVFAFIASDLILGLVLGLYHPRSYYNG